MGFRDRLNVAQRVVVSAALGMAIRIVGVSVELWGTYRSGGWFGYAPNTKSVFVSSGPFLVRHPALRAIWWLALTIIWAGVSLWLFATSHRSTPDAGDAP